MVRGSSFLEDVVLLYNSRHRRLLRIPWPRVRDRIPAFCISCILCIRISLISSCWRFVVVVVLVLVEVVSSVGVRIFLRVRGVLL